MVEESTSTTKTHTSKPAPTCTLGAGNAARLRSISARGPLCGKSTPRHDKNAKFPLDLLVCWCSKAPTHEVYRRWRGGGEEVERRWRGGVEEV